MSTSIGTHVVRAARPADAAACATLHRTGLPDAFLSSLGHRFLKRLYRRLIADPGARVLVAEQNGAVLGFVSGCLDARSAVESNKIAAGIAALPRILKPSVLRKARETASYEPPAGLPAAELLSIAVEPSARHAGIGASLTRALITELRRAGVKEFKVVAAASNEGANMFYAVLGATKVSTIEVHHGQPSNVWVFWKLG